MLTEFPSHVASTYPNFPSIRTCYLASYSKFSFAKIDLWSPIDSEVISSSDSLVNFPSFENLQNNQHQSLYKPVPVPQTQGENKTRDNIPLDNPLNTIKTFLQRLHLRSIAKPHEMMTGTIKQISPLARVQIEEDTRYDDDFLFETGLEEV